MSLVYLARTPAQEISDGMWVLHNTTLGEVLMLNAHIFPGVLFIAEQQNEHAFIGHTKPAAVIQFAYFTAVRPVDSTRQCIVDHSIIILL